MLSKLIVFILLIAQVYAKTILLTNDDSWASTYIRAAYRDLKKAGYDVIMVAPVRQQTGNGGSFQVPKSKTLEKDGEFGYVKKGAPSWDHDADDSNIYYFDGTTSACVAFALNYLIPEKFDNVKVDLTISGPNEGPGILSGFFTYSSTTSGAYFSVYNGIPAISFGGSDLNNTFFKDDLNNDKLLPANIYSSKIVELVDLILAKDAAKIPNTVGLNVNFPQVSTLSDKNCTDPTWMKTRILGKGVLVPSMSYNKKTELYEVGYDYLDDKQKDCEDGDCNLPSEYSVFFAKNCTSTVSVFSIDYDASLSQSNKVHSIIGDLF